MGVHVTISTDIPMQNDKKIAELEQRVKILELMVDEKLRKKISKGLRDEAERKLTSLKEYEEKYMD